MVLVDGEGTNFDQAETNNPDSDPFTSGDEYVADTNPTNAVSQANRLVDEALASSPSGS